MKRLIKTSLLLLSCSVVYVNAADLRIAVDGSYAPFAQVNAEGKLYGFDIDIAYALCHAMERTCTIVPQTWDGMIPGLQAGKFDAVISSMSVTKERSRVIDFSDHYYSNSLALIGPKSNHTKIDEKTLSGLTIGAYRSTVSSQYLEDNLADKVKTKLYDTQELAYLDLSSGRIDLLLSDKLPAYAWLREPAGKTFEFKGKDIDINDKVAVALRKGSPLRTQFNQAIKTIVENGTYQTINQNYFPFSIY